MQPGLRIREFFLSYLTLVINALLKVPVLVVGVRPAPQLTWCMCMVMPRRNGATSNDLT